MELSLSFSHLESLTIILKLYSMSKTGKISRLAPLVTLYVMCTPKVRFLFYFNKYLFIKLFIYDNKNFRKYANIFRGLTDSVQK